MEISYIMYIVLLQESYKFQRHVMHQDRAIFPVHYHPLVMLHFTPHVLIATWPFMQHGMYRIY